MTPPLVEDAQRAGDPPSGNLTPPGNEPPQEGASTTAATPEDRPNHRVRNIVLIVLGVLVLLVAAAALWFVLGRDQAEPLTEDQALVDFRAANGGSTEAAGRPAAGVYAATASGTESIGLPGFDEQLGPNAPVTVSYGDGGCWTYRADFNSHHWRSWTYCPSDTATFALVELATFTARKAPGLDVATLSTYTCGTPLDVLWSGAAAGDTRSGTCTGTTDVDDTVTDDAASAEVLGLDTLEVGGETVDVVQLRTADELSGDQTGTETGEWWLDATTGLPVKFSIESALSGAAGEYSETIELELTSLQPAT